jgi:glycosyltransferase involved in cell wall biosynthesis
MDSRTVGFDVSGLNPNFKAHAHRGIGRYVRELARGFSEKSWTNGKILSFDRADLFPQGAKQTFLDSFTKRSPVGRETVRQQILLPGLLNNPPRNTWDLFHFPAHMDVPLSLSKPFIVTVLDLIPLRLKELYAPKNPWDPRFRLARFLEISSIKKANYILTISEQSADDIVELLNYPRERILVTPLGVDAHFFDSAHRENSRKAEIRLKYKLPENAPVVLYVGGIDPRKNIPVLVDAMRRVRGEWPAERGEKPVLALAGSIKNDKHFPALSSYIGGDVSEGAISLLGFVSDEDLPALYASADTFCFPSLYEGFGLPLLEAMAVGTPVVSSDRSCLPGVGGDGALYCDPTDPDALAQKIIETLTDQAQCQAVVERGVTQASKFTWERTVELTLQGYDNAFEYLSR